MKILITEISSKVIYVLAYATLALMVAMSYVYTVIGQLPLGIFCLVFGCIGLWGVNAAWHRASLFAFVPVAMIGVVATMFGVVFVLKQPFFGFIGFLILILTAFVASASFNSKAV